MTVLMNCRFTRKQRKQVVEALTAQIESMIYHKGQIDFKFTIDNDIHTEFADRFQVFFHDCGRTITIKASWKPELVKSMRKKK